MGAHIRMFGIISVAALMLGACGKRGHLEAPGGQSAEKPPVEERAGPAGTLKAKRQPVVAPKRDLPIDWILE